MLSACAGAWAHSEAWKRSESSVGPASGRPASDLPPGSMQSPPVPVLLAKWMSWTELRGMLEMLRGRCFLSLK